MYYIIYCILNDLASFILRNDHTALILLYDIFTVAELCFFAAYFYFINATPLIRKVLQIIVVVFIIFSFVDHFYITQENYSTGVQAVLILIMCIYYFYNQLKKPNSFLIYNSINFWIIIAFLIYMAGTFFLYVIAENMVADKQFTRMYGIINFSFNLFKNILLSIAMLMREDKKTDNYIP